MPKVVEEAPEFDQGRAGHTGQRCNWGRPVATRLRGQFSRAALLSQPKNKPRPDAPGEASLRHVP